MKRRYIQIIINFILLTFLVIFQISLVESLPSIFNKINLLLVSLVFIMVLYSYREALWWAISYGLVLDIFSFHIFGTQMFSLLITLVLLNFLYVNFFTDKSLYSFFALGFFSILIYLIILHLLVLLFNIGSDIDFFVIEKEFWLYLFKAEIVNLIVVWILYFVNNFLNIRLKPVFLFREK
jgi:rod shape-determining protein MreD